MVRLEIVEPSNEPLMLMFPSQMVCLKIVEQLELCARFSRNQNCRTRKWPTLSNVSLANGMP